MTTIDCTSCSTMLPDLLLEGTRPPVAVDEHLRSCTSCSNEWRELQATWNLMDAWVAPDPSPYFDSKLQARLREAQATAPEGLWERLRNYVRFSTGRELRPALAGALAVLMLLGGSTAAIVTHHSAVPAASPTVNDLRIYDNNAQALQDMDMLDDGAPDGGQS